MDMEIEIDPCALLKCIRKHSHIEKEESCYSLINLTLDTQMVNEQ